MPLLLDSRILSQTNDSTKTLESVSTKTLESVLLDHNKCNERKQILYTIIFPLLKQLQRCYAAIDDIESSLPPREEAKETTTKPEVIDRKSKRKNAAPPPLGMLSLNDYVNVACLLEFAISITLIPTMEYPNLYQLQLNPYKNMSNSGGNAAVKVTKITSRTTTMAQRRIQALPKPLAGRISKSALTWGSKYASRMHASLYNSINNLVLSQNNTTEDVMIAQQSYDVYNTYHSFIEVILLSTSIGHLVLLDRFRPMLLPRHLSDIYLAVIIAERLRWVLLGLEKTSLKLQSKQLPSWCIGQREREIEKLTSCELQSLESALLFVSLKFPSTFITRVSSNEIAPTMTRRTIDHREAALACRTLLSGGAMMNRIE